MANNAHVRQRPGLVPDWRLGFFGIWTGQAISLVGSNLVQFALIWWLTEAQNSATALAMAYLAGTLPVVLIGPVAGVLVDRWNRRRVMVVADALIALCTALLAGLFWLGSARVGHVYLVLGLRASLGSFHGLAITASTPLMVPNHWLTRAAGMNATLDGANRFIAPVLGALLLVALGVHGVLILDVLTAAVAIVPLLLVQIPQAPVGPSSVVNVSINGVQSLLQPLWEGLRYVQSQRGLCLLFVSGALGGFLAIPAVAFLPLLVSRHFGGDAADLGLMQSAYGVGYLAGGIVLSAWGGFKQRIVTSAVGTSIIGCGILIIGVTPATAFLAAVAVWFIVGAGFPLALGPLRAVFQSTIPYEMQGRFFSLNDAVIRGLTPLGALLVGTAADTLDMRIVWVVAGVGLVGLALTRILTPSIYRLGSAREPGRSEVQDVP
jgi:DHA3 family macrolide efflux protein-like MFS transporter